MNWKKTLLICILILAVAAALLVWIFSSEPTAQREGATKESAMLVDVVQVARGAYQPTVVATGTVQPEQDIILSPRVSGEILEISPVFVPGGYVQKGDVLLRIDPADYQNVLQLRQSDLHQAEADLAIELGRQDVAKKDYALFNDTLSSENEALVLRKPQLNAARSQVEAARAAVQQAELDLQRTTIRAPFDAHILSRNVNKGSQVAPGNNLGRLVGLDNYWVIVTVPQAKLRWLQFPDATSRKGAAAVIRNRTAWGEDAQRSGHLFRLLGAIEDQTRMARVIVEVPDPLARWSSNRGKPPLMIGSFVEVSIEAMPLEDVVRVDRDYLRKDNTVWIMEDDKLRIASVDILFSDARYAYVQEGLSGSEKIVTTNLSTVTEGARLRLEGESGVTPADTTDQVEHRGSSSPARGQ